MSLSTLVAILVQSSMGSTPFNIRVNFDKILPYLSYDFRDSVVLGRWRESLVCVAGLTGPFLLLIGANVFSRYFEDDLFLGKGFLSPLIHMPGLCLAAWFSLIMITLPLGDSWGQSLIKSLFRNRHELPHEIPGVSKDNFFFGLMNFHDQMGQNRYFIAYTTYLILWLGAVFRLNTEFVAAQFNQAVSTFLLSEQFGFKLYFAAGMMLAGIILLVLMIFYVIWICGAGLIKELFIHKIITDKTQKARQDNSLENLIKKEWPDASAAKCREAAFLQGIDLFADWTPASIVHLVRRKSLEEFPENTTLISQGETNERFYIIHDGRVKVSRDHQEVAILTSGHVFGEISLIRHIPATATVTTLGHVQAYVFSRAEFLEIITRDFLTGYLLDMKSEARKGEE
ncbi:cyclic nucleotide-binding domain-containing protein [Kamptonema cortianum]|nr:cyclic nucleotide-binding domain-containing protein [Kamptonema cortianum]